MNVFRVGLNPYGLAYTTGLQGAGTPRANPNNAGLNGFLNIAREINARCIEIHDGWLRGMGDEELARLSATLDPGPEGPGHQRPGLERIVSTGLMQQSGETLEDATRCARGIGARVIRVGLSPVLEGSRSRWGARWPEMSAHARETLIREAPRAGEAGLVLAIEDHQDFGSEELVAMAEEAGENVGIVLDTGNPFAVGEDPVAFARRAAHRIRHVHLKDYRAQFTGEGYRLIRCAIGDGCVPLAEMAAVLAEHHSSLTASLEPGALEARHIRAFAPDWWRGYPPREASEFATAVGRLHHNRLADDEDYRTPWERGAPGSELVAYEKMQIERSVKNVRASGLL
jgi:sugar phosphate isomerase/epimerase